MPAKFAFNPISNPAFKPASKSVFKPSSKPSFELRLRVLNAVHEAPGNSMRERIKVVADHTFVDGLSGQPYRFTWRTVSTWLYRHKKNGIATLENKSRSCSLPRSRRTNQCF